MAIFFFGVSHVHLTNRAAIQCFFVCVFLLLLYVHSILMCAAMAMNVEMSSVRRIAKIHREEIGLIRDLSYLYIMA